MSTSHVPPSSANNDDDFEREQVVHIDDSGDITVRPVNAASLKIRERDREQIAELLAWAKRHQEEFDAGRRRQPKPDEPNPV